MDLSFSPEETAFREEVRQFLREKLPPELQHKMRHRYHLEKEDYVRFFDLLRLAPGAVVVADNVVSHGLTSYLSHVRARPGAESVTLHVGKGLEVTRIA